MAPAAVSCDGVPGAPIGTNGFAWNGYLSPVITGVVRLNAYFES
jgi:hypothetical protein